MFVCQEFFIICTHLFIVFVSKAFLTNFLQFKSQRKCRFLNRNTPSDADIVKSFSIGKSSTFTAQEPFCRFSPNVVPNPFFSGVVSLVSSQNHIPFGRSFSCQGTIT